MLTGKIVDALEFDDQLKAHVQVVSTKIEMLHESLYKEFQRRYGLESIVFSVMDNEISRMYNVIKQETVNRRSICNKYGKARVSDLTVSEITEGERDTVRKLYLHVLLPKTEKNRNIEILIKLIRLSIPLDIHFVLYQCKSSRGEFLDKIDSITCWKVDEDSRIVYNKAGKEKMI